VDDAAVDDGTEEIDVAINATPVGLTEDHKLPMPADQFDRCAAGLDMVYRKEATRFVAMFRALGKPVLDGRAMLVAQGTASFERFFPGEQAPREIMAAAVNQWIAPPS
jgi:shikimate 5-dehydrogenase